MRSLRAEVPEEDYFVMNGALLPWKMQRNCDNGYLTLFRCDTIKIF